MSDIINNPSQGGKYDKIFRENMQETLSGIIENVLRLKLTTIEELQDDIQYTKERKTDMLKKVRDAEGNVFILHIEIQKKNEKRKMVYRMAEYAIMLQRKYGGIPVLQHVIYIGKGKATMETTINTKDLQFRYNLTTLSAVDHELFLKSEKIEEKMLAILGNLDKQDPKVVLKEILLGIKAGASDELSEGHYIRQLHVLVQLRNLEQDLKQVMEAVESFFKIEKDPCYVEGREKGIEQGMELERTKAEKEKKDIALELKKIGVPIADIARCTSFSVKEIEAL